MKKVVLFIALITFVVNAAMAKLDKNLKCTLTLLDGTTVSGYMVDYKTKTISDGPSHLHNMVSLKIASKPDGEGVEYSANDSKKLVIKTKEGDSEFLSAYIMKNSTRPKNMKHGKTKCFIAVIYKQKGVYGLVSEASDFITYRSFNDVVSSKISTITYLYCLEGDEVVIPYWNPSDKLTIGAKGGLRLCFERFPKVVEYIKSDEFSMKMMKSNPLNILDIVGAYK